VKAGGSLLVAVHRWAGLAIALVLVVAGLTGAILPYQRELSVLAAPQVWRAPPPTSGAALLSGIDLMQRVEAETGGVVRYMPLGLDGRYAQAVFIGPRPDGPTAGAAGMGCWLWLRRTAAGSGRRSPGKIAEVAL
jgi:uncharacterized iron-regulated membrane protein